MRRNEVADKKDSPDWVKDVMRRVGDEIERRQAEDKKKGEDK